MKKNSLVIFLEDRGRKKADVSVDDIFEANLEESLTFDDLDLEDKESEELKSVVKNNKFLND